MTFRLQGRPGFALIASLWLVVGISAAALALTTKARASRLHVTNVLDRTRAEAAGRAGLEHARAWITDTTHKDLERFPASDTTALAGGGRFAIAIYDVGGRLNLNTATEDELRRLFRALHVDYGEADRLAQRIADWRDADDLERARGAERDTYLEQDQMSVPANRPFYEVKEIRQVLGMTDSLFARIQPHVTTTGSGRVNVNAASEPVLLALPGMTPEAASVIFRKRMTRQGVTSLDEVANQLTPGARAMMRAAMPELMLRTTTTSSEIVAEVTGWSQGTPYRAVARGLLVRSRNAVFLVERTIR